MKTRVILILTILISVNAFGNSAISKVDTVKVTYNLPPENNNLRDLYDNQKETNDKLLSLLTTSLTLIVGIIIAVIGTSIFYNYRFNKKEYELLTKENKNTLNEMHNELIASTNSKLEKTIENFTSEIDKRFEQINNTYKTNIETIKESLNTIVLLFRKDIDKQIDGITKQIEANSSEIKDFSDTAKKDVQYNAKSLKKDLLDLQGEIYIMKEWYTLALNTFVNQGLLCVELNQTWQLEYILGDIINAMMKVIEKDNSITPDNKKDIEKLLPTIPDYLSREKEVITKNYQKIKIKEIILPKRDRGYVSLRDLFRAKK